MVTCFQFVKRMNGNVVFAISKACSISTCFQFVKRMNGNKNQLLRCRVQLPKSCFQFAKRMNGNARELLLWFWWWCRCLLPIREAYEWKLVSFWDIEITIEDTCFQFVKRMNGNSLDFWIASVAELSLLPIREAYEWKRCVGLTHELTLQFF